MGEAQGGAAAVSADERVVRPEFTGTAAEYFRVWIVNLFFTLATLGIYSAWAKVRKRRYLYGCTRLDGESFDYFASPKAVLRGRIVAVAIFVAYALAGEVYPPAHFAFWAIGALALPWLLVKALSFNARNSAYRGLRFDFEATPGQAARSAATSPISRSSATSPCRSRSRGWCGFCRSCPSTPGTPSAMRFCKRA